MHIILWEFTVAAEHVEAFKSAYKADGSWAQLFRRAEGYMGTELLRSPVEDNRFVTIDRWESSSCFDRFQEQFGEEYRRLDLVFERYTLSERKLGAFEDA